MDDKKTTDQLIREFGYNLSSKSPNILKYVPVDSLVWEFIDDCNTIVLVLITKRILKNKSIEAIVEKFDECINIIIYYLEPTDQIRLGIHWVGVLDYMNQRCLEEDQFEACSNIKKFKDKWFPSNINE